MFLKQVNEILQKEKSTYTIDELLKHFDSSSIIVCLFLATIITSIPLPPWGGGFETIPFGGLCIFLALQGLFGLNQVYLPSSLKTWKIDISFVQKSKSVKNMLSWIKSKAKENRYKWVFNPIMEKIMYLLVIGNAVLMMIPIVFTNGIPSQCITLMSLAWLLYDGLFYLIMVAFSSLVIFVYIFLFITFGRYFYYIRKNGFRKFWKKITQ